MDLLMFLVSAITVNVFIAFATHKQDSKIVSFKDGVMIIKIIKPLSFYELFKKYGMLESKFYCKRLDKNLLNYNHEPGIYEIQFKKQLVGLTDDQQKKEIPEEWDFPHPAILTQAILKHYYNTGEKLLKNWQSRTSFGGSKESSICVGSFSKKLSVYYAWKSGTSSFLGVVLFRKIS